MITSSAVIEPVTGAITAVDQDDPSARLTARSSVEAGVAVLTLFGELTGGTRSALVEAVRGCLESSVCAIVVDLGSLRFLDGRGLAALVVAARMIADGGAAVRLKRPTPLTRRLLELAGLSQLCATTDQP